MEQKIIKEIEFVAKLPFQQAAIGNPFTHFAYFAGVSSGKTFTGSHFIIEHIIKHPEKTGFIGANDYVQLSTATLRELFHWLNHYGFEYVIDKMPPKDWGQSREFKDYENILSVRNPWTDTVSVIFTRVMSNHDSLRGIQFSYYWLDEVRDTKLEAHDVVLSRLRESNYIKGLVTTTTNGEDWCHDRFCKKKDGVPKDLYGSMHIETYESVRYGIITESFYMGMLASYSPLMAEQELFAKHVNIYGGKAYYAASKSNATIQAPWGDLHPNPDFPLVIGMDFNFSPAPCVWIVGQIGQNDGRPHIHWFGEISESGIGTPDMCMKLVNQYPGHFYRMFGDASATKGSTSNQGETDVIHIQQFMAEWGHEYSLDIDQSNPRVKNRVENMNRLLCNARKEISMTYNPHTCPHFDGDMKIVGWKPMLASGANRGGRLDDNGDNKRTHSSDGAGYAAWKLFPPVGTVRYSGNIKRAHAD